MGIRLWPARRSEEERTSWPALSFSEGLAQAMSTFLYGGNAYTLPSAKQEEIRDFEQLVSGAYKSDGVVFACMDVRAKLFSEARFQWRARNGGKPGKLFGTADLGLLEEPWAGGTTGDLLYRMLQFVDLAGNAFVVNRGSHLALLRPDLVDIVAGSPKEDAGVWDVDTEVIGYAYHPHGRTSGDDPEPFLPEEVCHFAPIPDPGARFRGMSWLTPVIREIMADKAATDHKLKFFENGATPNLLVKFDLDSVEKMRPWIELFKEQHEGSSNAYKTLFVGAGTEATAVGANFQQMDFKVTQGAGETRIAAAAGVPPVIVGLSEGLQAATYSNYSQARRRFADGTMRPLWRNLCGSLARIVTVPPNSELWYDDRDIPALKEDIQDKAKEMQENATAANQLVSAGYDPDSIVQAIDAGDFSLLTHSGLVSVQLQPPGKDSVQTPGVDKVDPVTTNGKAPAPA
jgi:phage portal protein BeeE